MCLSVRSTFYAGSAGVGWGELKARARQPSCVSRGATVDPQVLHLESDSAGQPISTREAVLNVSPPRALPALTLARRGPTGLGSPCSSASQTFLHPRPHLSQPQEAQNLASFDFLITQLRIFNPLWSVLARREVDALGQALRSPSQQLWSRLPPGLAPG